MVVVPVLSVSSGGFSRESSAAFVKHVYIIGGGTGGALGSRAPTNAKYLPGSPTKVCATSRSQSAKRCWERDTAS